MSPKGCSGPVRPLFQDRDMRLTWVELGGLEPRPPDRKMGTLAGVRQRTLAGGGAVRFGPRLCGSGCLDQGDGVAEGFELADVAACLALGVGAAGVVGGAELAEVGGGVGEQVPDDDQDGAGDGDQGLELADPLDQPPVPFAGESVCPGGRRGGLAEDALEVRVALAGLAGAVAGPGLDGARGQLGPRHQVPGGGEPGHVQSYLGKDGLCPGLGDAGDVIEARGRWWQPPPRPGSPAAPAWTRAAPARTPSPRPWPRQSRPPAQRSTRDPHPRSPAVPSSPALSQHPIRDRSGDARGPRSGTEILTGVLEATVRDPSRSGPAARLP